MKSKKTFVLLFIVIIITCLIVGFLYFKSNEKKEFSSTFPIFRKISYKENMEVSLGADVPNNKEYSSEFQNDIFWLDDSIKEGTTKTGIYKGVTFENFRFYFVELTVIDNQAPMIEGVKDITLYVGDNIDLEKGIKVTDDSGEKIELKIKGDYSTEKEGTYPLAYEAIDNSGNIATADFKLIVKKKEVAKPSQKPVASNNNMTVAPPPKTSKGYEIIWKRSAYYINDILIVNKTFPLAKTYGPGSLTAETHRAYQKMQKDASKEGIDLKIISGYRSYFNQEQIYNNYVKRDGKKEADRYSARPGHSEHQTGMAFDVNSLEQSFGETKEGIWLKNNCYKYGFILRYPKGKESITGYMYEPWHFRYIGNKASELYNDGNWITLEEYLGIDSKYDS